MSDSQINAVLTPSEWRIIEALRSLPGGSLRDRAQDVLGEMLFFVKNPRCQGMGVEGFACGDPRATCDECQEMWDVLDALAERIGKAKQA